MEQWPFSDLPLSEKTRSFLREETIKLCKSRGHKVDIKTLQACIDSFVSFHSLSMLQAISAHEERRQPADDDAE